MPPVIHIAGTNGKGSTTAFLRALAGAHGLRVHIDTSPHLIRVNERIRVAGELISDDALRRHIDTVLEANDGEPLSFFEGMTIASFLAFTETEADLTLVEVGLGGRFDSTNVFAAPKVSVITPIAFDHKEFLGSHLCQIAWEKAGIIKPGCPVVSASQTSDIARTLRAEASYRDAPISFLSEKADLTVSEGSQSIRLPGLELNDVELSLSGPHQLQNAALALLAFQTASICPISDSAVRMGLANAKWPARLQTLSDGPVTQKLDGKKVLLDGGHNPHAAKAIAQALAADAPVTVIVAMLGNKDARSFLEIIAPVAERVIAVPMPGDRNGHAPDRLAGIASGLGMSASTAGTLSDALELASGTHSQTVLICGSLYFAGDVLKANEQVID